MKLGVPIVGSDVGVWANDLRRWIARTWDTLSFKETGAQATQNGVMLWDTAGYPVISKDGAWRQIVLADGYAAFGQDADITAALADTAYAITWDAAYLSDGITLAGSPATKITATEAGKYVLSFTAQIQSTSASTVNFRFWPRLNGVDVSGSTMVCALHTNGATLTVSRSAIFELAAADYIEAMWATDSTSGLLKAHAATAYAPASPSVTLAVIRIRQ